MNNIKIFENQEFGAIRTMSDEQGETWFCAKDVCDALQHTNSRRAIAKLVDEGDVTKRYTPTSSGEQQMTFINESGLYALILSSKLESAKRFKHWVTSEVLPSIRKQGGYMVALENESNEVILSRALQIMQATIQRRDEQIAQLKPKADYAELVLDSVSCLTTTQIAKGMGMTANELNRILCQKRIQYGQSGQYLLYAPFARQGLAQNRTRTFRDLFGAVHTTSQLVWTEKGRQFIYKTLTQNNSPLPSPPARGGSSHYC